ncbi:MAG: alpha/beta fold hydrolase [Deltaproteobacteria bacterium]|nr:alpha/beta fold hydrolase [Deltaproteobacteria bacterium]
MKTLILLHGWGADGSFWEKQVLAFRGQIKVETPTIPAWDPAWLKAYLQNFSLVDCLLVGWSLGGMMLLEVLARQPATVGGLILVGVAPVFCRRSDYPWGQPPVAVRAMRRALQSNPRKVVQDFAGSCLSPSEGTFQEEVTSLFSTGNSANLAAGLDYLLSQDLRPLLPNLAAPCTIIQGDEDRIVPPGQARFLHEHLSGSKLHLVPAAGHLPFWTQDGRFNGILEEIVGGGQQAPNLKNFCHSERSEAE